MNDSKNKSECHLTNSKLGFYLIADGSTCRTKDDEGGIRREQTGHKRLLKTRGGTLARAGQRRTKLDAQNRNFPPPLPTSVLRLWLLLLR